MLRNPGIRGLTIRSSSAIVIVYDFVLDEETFLEQVTDHILAAARKVIAVHINYPSRAAQRGLNNVSIDGLTSTRPDRRIVGLARTCLLYTSPSPRDLSTSRMPSSA